MASIAQKRRKDGSPFWLVQIVKRKIDYSESKTFPTEKQAAAWAKKREAEIDADIANGKTPTSRKIATATLGDAIDKYVEQSAMIRKTKAQCLATIKDYDIASKPCHVITSTTIVKFAQDLQDRPVSPSTILNYLSHLSAVFSIARPMWGIPLDQQAMKDAFVVCKKMGITAKSRKRERRPTLAELDLLFTRFERRKTTIPMAKITAFAIFSGRRQEEICSIRWDDFDELHKRILVRDMKDPHEKSGNDIWCDLPDPCTEIINSMPKTDERIFPFKHKTVSSNFTRTCALVGIEGLHFHDLRHEAASRLCEMGYSIPQITQVTGHQSWTGLKRYAQPRQHGDKYKDWSWHKKVTTPVDNQMMIGQNLPVSGE